jgi:hypothetical protein
MNDGMMMWATDLSTSNPSSVDDGFMLDDSASGVLFNSTQWPFAEMANNVTSNISGTVLTMIPAFGDVELDLSVIERFRSNRRVNDVAFFCLVAAYCVLIIFGTIGNSLVVYVVACHPAMRTARNVFVVNLAISDLLLCLITMPLTVSVSFHLKLFQLVLFFNLDYKQINWKKKQRK